MSLLLALLYPIAIQYERGGWWRILLPVTLLALAIDVLANWTELAIVFGLPRRGEWTFSKRLRRLSLLPGWRSTAARWCIAYTDFFDPDGYHI